MKIIIFLLVSILSIIYAEATGCENHAVSKNIANNGQKFHLKDTRTNQYLIVEANTMVLRTVTPEEFESAKQSEITWFTACNGFTQVSEDNANNYEICMAGLESQRLYHDQFYGFFVFMEPQPSSTSYLPMNLRLVMNEQSNSIERASLFCSRGQLQLERNFIKIGSSQTLLSVE